MPFAIYPLIYSAGPDKVFSIVSENGVSNTADLYGSVDPFLSIANRDSYPCGPVGWTADIGPPGTSPGESNTPGWSSNMQGWLDNIHNHLIGTK